MKIVFLGFASSFTPGMTYQDNLLCEQVLADGHEVTYISNPEKFVNGKIEEVGEEDVFLPDGLHLIRLKYIFFISRVVTKKIRLFRGVYSILEKEKPDIIFCHNTQYKPILDAVKYKKNHPKVKLYADTHTASYNSGTNWLSLHVLHRIYYKWLLQRTIPFLDKFFYVGENERMFATENYGVPETLMEYFPLGGILPSIEKYQACRARVRAELSVMEDVRLYIHSGKLTASKRTEELLKAFSAVKDKKSKMVLIGLIPEEMKTRLYPLIEADNRIVFLGWKNGEELQEYLCGCDLYCQPGSVSATMQNAICCSCAIIAYPHLAYTAQLDWGNILWIETQEDMEKVFLSIADNPRLLNELGANSRRCAEELLDYRKLAARLYQ